MKTHLTILKKLGQDQGALGSAIACQFLLLAVAPFARAQVQTGAAQVPNTANRYCSLLPSVQDRDNKGVRGLNPR
jgi:hypothetical protein